MYDPVLGVCKGGALESIELVYDSVLGVCSLEEAEQYDKRELDSVEQDRRVGTHQNIHMGHGTTTSTTIPGLSEFCVFIILLCLFYPSLTRFGDVSKSRLMANL